MKQIFLHIIFSMLMISNLLSQNLLYNGGFEDGEHYGDNLHCCMITNGLLDNWETDCKICDKIHAYPHVDNSIYYPHSPDWFDKRFSYGYPPYEGDRLIGIGEYEVIEQPYNADFNKNDILFCKFQLKRLEAAPDCTPNNFSGMKMNIYLAKEKIKYKSDDDNSGYCEHKDFLNSQSLFLAKSIDLNDVSLGYSDWNKISFLFEAPDPSYNWFAIEIVRTDGTCDHNIWSYVLIDDVQLMHYCSHPCMKTFPPIKITPSEIPELCIVNANPGIWYINVENAQRIELFITDQWGGIHYFSDFDINGLVDLGYNDYQFIWNGYYSDYSLMPEDTYAYRLLVSNCNQTEEKFGHIQVVHSSQVNPLIVSPEYINLIYDDEDCCQANIILSNITDETNYYLASNTIITSGQYYCVPQDVHVTFDAGEEIVLGPGFHANNGSDFTAKIKGCNLKLRNAKLFNPVHERNSVFVKNCTDPIKEKTIVFPDEFFALVNVFPNPTSDLINISCNIDIIRIEIRNNLGFVVSSKKFDNMKRIQTDISFIEPGVYQVWVTTKDDKVVVKPFVKVN